MTKLKFKGDVVVQWLPDGRTMLMYKAFRTFGPHWDSRGNLLEIRQNSDELYL